MELIEEVVVPDYTEIAQKLRDERDEAMQAAVLAAVEGLPVHEASTVYDFALPKPVDLSDGRTVRVTRIVVRVTRYPGGVDDTDREGWVEVKGYGKPVSKSGQVLARAVDTYVTLPASLGAPLVLQAMTRTPAGAR